MSINCWTVAKLPKIGSGYDIEGRLTVGLTIRSPM